MQATITPDHEKSISTILKAAGGSGDAAVWSNAFIQAGAELSVICGNGVIELSKSMPAAINQQGSALVDAQKLLQCLSVCKFNCIIELNDGFLHVIGKSSKFKIKSLNPDSYPSYPDVGQQTKLDLDAADLVSKVKLVSKCSAKNDVRYYINGVKIGSCVAASNGHRMAMASCSAGGSSIIPIKSVGYLPDDAKAIYLSNSFMTVESNLVTFKTSLVDGRYPDVARVIGKPEFFVSVDVGSILSALKAAQVVMDKEKPTVLIEVNQDGGSIITKSKSGDESAILFNASSEVAVSKYFTVNYLIDAFSFYSGQIDVGFTDNSMVISVNDLVNVVACVKP